MATLVDPLCDSTTLAHFLNEDALPGKGNDSNFHTYLAKSARHEFWQETLRMQRS
jgi:hypothetical protein